MKHNSVTDAILHAQPKTMTNSSTKSAQCEILTTNSQNNWGFKVLKAFIHIRKLLLKPFNRKDELCFHPILFDEK